MNRKGLLVGSGIVIEIAGLVLLGNGLATGSMSVLGIVFLVMGLVTVVVGMAGKTKRNEHESG
jgi:hypothetical protein